MTCSHDPCIEIRRATVMRGRRRILHEITLDVRCSEFLVLLGPNGSGKTTLLKLINGIVFPHRGSVLVLGKATSFLQAYKLRQRIGYVPQVDHVDPKAPLTVRESVAMGRFGRLGFFRKLKVSDWEKVEEAMSWVGIDSIASQPLGSLSGGEFQKVAIARVLAQEPSIFLFDEPNASIDPFAQREIITLIERMHDETKATTIYVTHDLTNLPARCDRIVFMKNGRVIREGQPNSGFMDEIRETLYVPDFTGKGENV